SRQVLRALCRIRNQENERGALHAAGDAGSPAAIESAHSRAAEWAHMTPDFFDVQVAMYEKLRQAQAFAGIGVYDSVPDDAVYPYIVIDTFTAARDGM